MSEICNTLHQDLDSIFSAVRDPSGATTYAGISGGTGGDSTDWGAAFYYTAAVSLALYGTYSLDYMWRTAWFRKEPDVLIITYPCHTWKYYSLCYIIIHIAISCKSQWKNDE